MSINQIGAFIAQANGGQNTINTLKDWIDLAQGVTQIAFFFVIAVVTVLTYKRAKKTILQPLRTEIFKKQLDDFSRVIRMFQGKEELTLRRQWDWAALADLDG